MANSRKGMDDDSRASLFQVEKGADARILQKRSRDEDEAFVHASKAYCILAHEASNALCGCPTLGGARMANSRKGMDDDSNGKRSGRKNPAEAVT